MITNTSTCGTNISLRILLLYYHIMTTNNSTCFTQQFSSNSPSLLPHKYHKYFYLRYTTNLYPILLQVLPQNGHYSFYLRYTTILLIFSFHYYHIKINKFSTCGTQYFSSHSPSLLTHKYL
jgi:hypothetical protein